MQEQKGETAEVLENLDSLEKRQKIRKILVIAIIFVLLVVIIILGVSFYLYFQSPEKTLGIGANIESSLLSLDGKLVYIKLLGGSLDKNITKIKFIFNDSYGNEHVYETIEGVKEIEVPFKRSFWDWLFGKPAFSGKYDYQINSENVGIDNFENVNEVSVLFEYQTETGETIETPVLDTKRTTNRTTTTGGGSSSGGTGDGGTTTLPPVETCTNDAGCTSVGSFCDNNNINLPYNCSLNISDGCLDRVNGSECGGGGSCNNGNCIQIIPICIINVAITQNCLCSGIEKSNGYCCSSGWQQGSCTIFEASYYVDNLIADNCTNYNVSTRSCLNGDKKAFNTIQKGVNVLQPGDVLAVRDGVYRESVSLGANGTSTNQITIKNYPGEKPIMEGTQVLSGWIKCSNQSTCLGNPNWQNIYISKTNMSLTDKLLFENGDFLQIAEYPDQSDPAMEQVSEFVSLVDEGNNFGHSITSINPGQAGVGSFGILDPDGLYSTLFKNGEKIIVGIKKGTNPNNGTFSLTRDAEHANGNTILTVDREVFDVPYNNTEVENQRFFVDSDKLVQVDDYWNGTKIRFWTHGANNWVVTKYVKDFVQARHMVIFDVPLQWAVSPGGEKPDAYSFQNHPLILDKTGEFYHTTQPDLNGNYTIYLWPRNPSNLENKIGISTLTRGFYINYGYGNYITIDGFIIRGYSGSEGSSRAGGIICPYGFNHEGLIIKNNVVYNNQGYGGISIQSGNYDIVENNVVYNILAGYGILITGANGKAIGNEITKTGTTSLKIGLKKGLLMNNTLGIGSTHANGISIYEGNKNILVIGNRFMNSRLTFQNCFNLTIYNNILDGKGGYVVADWGANCENVKIFNNIIIGDATNTNALYAGSPTTTSKNNIIQGGSTKNRSYNIYIARAWSQNPGNNWSLKEGEIVADGTTVYGPAYTINDIFENLSQSYKLKENSIAIDSGTNIINDLPDYLNDPFFAEADFYKDIEGNPRPRAGWNIGPYEELPCEENQQISCINNSLYGVCKAGTRTCLGGVYGSCVQTTPSSSEICDDNLDNDCDSYKDCNDPECFSNSICQMSVPPDFVSWWKFDENANDEAGNHNGVLVNNPSYVAGVHGQALSFDGTNRVSISPLINLSKPFTIVAWIYPVGTGSWQAVTGPDGNNAIYNNAGTLRICDSAMCTNYGSLSLNTWYQIAYIAQPSGTMGTVYENGIQIGTKNGYANGWSISVIGCRAPYYNCFNGSIDEVMIYNRALNDSEILQIYCNRGGDSINPGLCSAIPSLSPFTKLWNFLKGLLTRETGNAILTGKVITGNVVNETREDSRVPYIILSIFVVIILIIAVIIVKIKKNKKKFRKK